MSVTEPSTPTVLLLAGEASGDLHGARLARALRERIEGVRLLGLGGPRMEAEGVELLEGLERLAVMGFVEVVSRLPFFWRLERRIGTLLRSGTVDLVIAIDYPGFNLRAVEKARAAGVPSIFYIAPQVWAWKRKRAGRLARAADRIAVILPFEVEIFRAEGAQVRYVGHPLLDPGTPIEDREAFCRRWGFRPDDPILAIFPGSRPQELARHLDPFLDTGRRLAADRPDLQLAIARVRGLELEADDVPGATLVDDSRALLRHARAALVKSGTTTLEAAIEGTPFVVAYRTSPVTYRLARWLVSVEHVALANLVAGRRVVPEFLQSEVEPDRLVPALEPLIDGGRERDAMVDGLSEVRERLGTPGAADRVARMARELLGREGLP